MLIVCSSHVVCNFIVHSMLLLSSSSSSSLLSSWNFVLQLDCSLFAIWATSFFGGGRSFISRVRCRKAPDSSVRVHRPRAFSQRSSRAVPLGRSLAGGSQRGPRGSSCGWSVPRAGSKKIGAARAPRYRHGGEGGEGGRTGQTAGGKESNRASSPMRKRRHRVSRPADENRTGAKRGKAVRREEVASLKGSHAHTVEDRIVHIGATTGNQGSGPRGGGMQALGQCEGRQPVAPTETGHSGAR